MIHRARDSPSNRKRLTSRPSLPAAPDSPGSSGLLRPTPAAKRAPADAAVVSAQSARRQRAQAPPQRELSSPLVGEGCGALANAVSLGEAGWGVPPHDRRKRCTYETLPEDAGTVRRHPPSQPSPTRGEGEVSVSLRRCTGRLIRSQRASATHATAARGLPTGVFSTAGCRWRRAASSGRA